MKIFVLHYSKLVDRKCKIKLPSDWWLNVAARDNNFKVYWA
jgi:hypothetical protein